MQAALVGASLGTLTALEGWAAFLVVVLGTFALAMGSALTGKKDDS